MAHFSQGLNTHRVPMSLHAENRERLLSRFQAPDVPSNSFILLEGGKQECFHDTDRELLFRQESFFHWLFGVKEADCSGALDITNKKSILFIPRLPESYAVWMGKIHPPAHYQKMYEVDEVRFNDEMDATFKQANASVLYVLSGHNSDSGSDAKPATFPGIEKYRVDNGRLHPEMVELRVIKTKAELDVLRYANKVSSEAHKHVMQHCKPGMKEYQLESLFMHHTYSQGGCRNVAYTCICGSGENGAILHYGHAGAPNEKDIKDGDMMLMDMGAEYHCYCSDITCSYPANGRFTPQQAGIYNAVLASQRAVEAALKPGARWPDMHTLSYKVILEHLRTLGLVQGDIDEMIKANIGALFMPHGLGHFMGLDTHDVGGYPKGHERILLPGYKSLRTVREMKAGMVITVEPGIYFNFSILDPAMKDPIQSKFLVAHKLEEYRNFGGVRLEDDVIITETGCDNMTQVPRTTAEIEAWMAARHSHC